MQLDCRSERNVEIAQMNMLFGQRCQQNTMQLALNTFDIGTNDGLIEATQLAFLMSRVCMCKQTKCDEAQWSELRDKVRERDIDPNKNERAGVSSMSNALAGHECLDSTIGVELYKKGYTCGLITGSRSALLRSRLEGVFVKTFGEEDGRQLADTCWAEQQSLTKGR